MICRLNRKQQALLGVTKIGKVSKVLIFIRHGDSIWNNLKNSGHKWRGIGMGVVEYFKLKGTSKQHKDTWVVDAPLSTKGIDQAYALSKFLGRHAFFRQYENLNSLLHHQQLANPIKDALRILTTDILDKYQFSFLVIILVVFCFWEYIF